MACLRENRYGKTGVRLVKVTRQGQQHTMREWTVRVLLEGDFSDAHLLGDNSKVLATDTMKNTVYSLAGKSSAESMEEFASELTVFFLKRNPQVHSAEVHIEAALWKRMDVDGNPHPHAFIKGSNELATATFRQTRTESKLLCGIEEMVVLKTTRSAFTGFIRDEWTTLKETNDRLLGTSITASWIYGDNAGRYNDLRERIRESLLHTFATHDSLSVQQTLFAMAKDAIEAVPQLQEITLTLPNRHNILVDLSVFGQSNENEIFMPIDDPSGYIEARVTRS